MSAIGLGRCAGVGASLAILCSVAGCSKNEDSTKVQSLQGKVEKLVVNPDGTGRITVLFFSEKQNQEIAGTGEITPETEILINGAVAKLSDIREGERVRGEVRVERKGDVKTQTVLKIHVERAKPVESTG